MRKLLFKSNKIVTISLLSILCISILGITLIFNNRFTNDKNALSNNHNEAIGSSISANGYTITLNDVTLDKGNLTINSTIKSDEKPIGGFPSVTEYIYIDGQHSSSNSDSVSDYVDDYTVNQETTYFISNEISDDVSIKLEYSGIQLLNDNSDAPININGPWVFDFNSNEITEKN